MNRHVEIVRLEGVCHISKGAECVVSGSLFKAERNLRLAALLQKIDEN